LNKPFEGADPDLNVFGEPLVPCSSDPVTGFFRNGGCTTGAADYGRHVICAEMTDEFLAFSKSRGNDLSTPRPEMAFPGLKAGDRWCLVAVRWLEALEAGMAPRVALLSTHLSALEFVTLEQLKPYALDVS
jgi:uncharacterized protein (DUF2237 family)